MSNTDTSSSARLRQVKAQTLAAYHSRNPGASEAGRLRSMDSSARTARVPGAYPVVRVIDQKPAVVTTGCCACSAPSAPTNVQSTNPFGGMGYMTMYISWTPVEGATSYTFSSSRPAQFTNVTSSSALMTFEYPYLGVYDNPTVTVTAVNACGSASASPVPTNPCFLAGSCVALDDGSTKAIEDVRVGDAVRGAFGELNYVLALHRPLLGSARMVRINEEHSSTAHHPHISVDKQFYCDDVAALEGNTYGKEHDVMDAAGNVVRLMLHGLRAGRVKQYTHDVMLQTVDGGREIKSLTSYNLPPETQLYNLVVSGSHTYCVDGYAVTGWPREDDFDYENWVPL